MQRALIVDDSKTAQIRLKKMLQPYDLQVDTAQSGEDALAYLSYRTPVVIFMDHTMEGMDGFEALKIIKANPNTAMIPVVMYTAQKGDVYVGQARALGAQEILSKEVIKPSNLEKVLRNLNIRPRDTDSSQAPTNRASSEKSPAEDKQLNQIRSQIARLFEIHIADVRTQITENTKFIVRRLSRDLEKRNEAELIPKDNSGDLSEAVIDREVAAERSRLGLVSSSLLILILLAIGALAWLIVDTREQIKTPVSQVPLPVQDNSEINAALAAVVDMRNRLTQMQQDNRRLLTTLSWALENDLRFPFGSPALGENQVNKLYSLVYMLDNAGFAGNIVLEIHTGNFCLTEGVSGNWVLAPPETPVTACTPANDLSINDDNGDYLSIEYLNFEQTASPLTDGHITLEVDYVGGSQARYPYPPLSTQTTAEEWNKAAALNNRLSLVF